jgi:aspartate/methionine/tyrosine aminotransferase
MQNFSDEVYPFGSEGEGHVRFALVLPPEEIKKAVEAVGAWL